jgi:ATP-dependent RNA helicase RhlE
MTGKFETLPLDDRVLDGIRDLGYKEMTEIQEKAIPIALEGKDLIAASQTGTGKTAAFLIPMLDRLVRLPEGDTRALILTPTRELALQIDERLSGLAYHAGVTSGCVVGGLSFGYQERIIREKTEILIATPGRLIDHMRFDHVDFGCIEVLVLDEADRMFDMGFYPSVQEILKALPTDRQTLLFSATIGKEVKDLAAKYLRDPVEIQIGRQVPVSTVKQRFFDVSADAKDSLVVHLLQDESMESVLIFARTKRGVIQLHRKLERAGIPCDSLHGDRPQEERTEALERFRRGEIAVLVATDIASRGLDITDVSHVINFDIPHDTDDYIHRVGRTARAKKTGDAITFVTREDHQMLGRIERAIKQKIQLERAGGFRRRPRSRR